VSATARVMTVMPRALELALTLTILVATLPLMLAVALAILLDSGGPVLFRQVRAGQAGRPLPIHKFRTLDPDTPDDAVTPDGDARVTRVGRLLRRYRLDELPQLFDVIGGRLALVGPRPEREVDLACLTGGERRALLAIRPGITGPVQLDFIGEDAVLADAGDPADVYRRILIPAKCAANLTAFRQRSVRADLASLVRTMGVLFSPRARRASRARQTALIKARRGSPAAGGQSPVDSDPR